MRTDRTRFILLLLVLSLLLPLMSGCASVQAETSDLTSFRQFTTQRVGVQSGTNYGEELLKLCPEVEIAYYSAASDLYLALRQGKLDAFLIEEISYNIKKSTFPWLKLLDGAVLGTPIGVAVSEHGDSSLLYSQLEQFILQGQENGRAEEMETYWLTEFDPANCRVDRSGITGENGTLSVAVENGYEPFSYYGDGQLQGYDIDFVYRFCREYGYEPAFFSVEYDTIPVGLSTGKFDLGMGVIISEERSENILFTDPYVVLEIYAAVKGDLHTPGAFWASLAHKFEQTFLRENRWLLFLQGAGTTLLISVLAALFGILFGFLMYLLCKRSRLFCRLNGYVSWVIGGTPTVLLLMILYYLVFVGRANIGGVWVAVVGFTILFGYTVLEILTTGASAIGTGQTEGARALGYSANQAFFHVVLPQALRIAFPQLKSELVGLIKETSIVGYISIADLTRMSDIVRGRTYEAFFPLITSTVIYFFLIWLILFAAERVEFGMTSRQRRLRKLKKGIRVQSEEEGAP